MMRFVCAVFWMAAYCGTVQADCPPSGSPVFRHPVELPVAWTFGVRFHPVLRYRRPHPGIDYDGQLGTPVRAAADGVVTFVGRRGEYGNHVQVRHSNGSETG